MGNYLITGAAGFIGSALASRLAVDGHRVVTIDNLSTGDIGNVPKGVELVQGNCQDPDTIARVPRFSYDAIIHAAGQSSGEISFEDPSYDLRTNTESTLHLLQFALSIGCPRFIYASTMSVYGVKPDYPVREDEAACPVSFYGVGKLASEHYIRIYAQYGIRGTSLRLFNVYGPGQNLRNMKQGMVSIYLKQMLDSGQIVVKGAGDRYRDFVYIDDVVEAFRSCLDNEKTWGEIINIGSGTRTTVRDLLTLLMGVYGHDVNVAYAGSTPGDLHGIYADIGKAERLMGYRPAHPLNEGVAKMMRWANG